MAHSLRTTPSVDGSGQRVVEVPLSFFFSFFHCLIFFPFRIFPVVFSSLRLFHWSFDEWMPPFVAASPFFVVVPAIRPLFKTAFFLSIWARPGSLRLKRRASRAICLCLFFFSCPTNPSGIETPRATIPVEDIVSAIPRRSFARAIHSMFFVSGGRWHPGSVLCVCVFHIFFFVSIRCSADGRYNLQAVFLSLYYPTGRDPHFFYGLHPYDLRISVPPHARFPAPPARP